MGCPRLSSDGVAYRMKTFPFLIESGETIPLSRINQDKPADFPLGTLVNFFLDMEPLAEGNMTSAWSLTLSHSGGSILKCSIH